MSEDGTVLKFLEGGREKNKGDEDSSYQSPGAV